MWHRFLVFWNILLVIKISAEEVGDDCAPSSEVVDGVCALITDCEVAVRQIKKQNYHSFERCGFSGDLEIVCCPRTTDKFGPPERGKISERKSDRECKNIIESSIQPINLNIIGGEVASLGEFPHMVALGFDRGNGYQFDCGGALISRSYVLTAAHCIDNLERVEPTIARAGVVEIGDNAWNDETDYRIARSIVHPDYARRLKYHDIALLRVRVVEIGDRAWNDETDYRIAHSIVHPDYERRLKYHDIALLRLESPVRVSSTLNAVCLHTSDADPTEELTVTGWGRTSTTKNLKSTVLLKANISGVSRERCAPHYSAWRKLPQGIIPQQVCAIDPLGHSDACQGDSGGPLQVSLRGENYYRLVGVTSFGNGCGTTTPGVYTRVSSYLDWIESVVWPN